MSIATTITTGRIILIQEEIALVSQKLFGGMYLKGSGEEIISQLSQVYTRPQFMKFLFKTCRRDFGFNKNELPCKLISIEDFTTLGYIDFNNLNYESLFNADWLYFKNIRASPVNIKFIDGYELNLEPFETIASRVGEAIPYPQKNITKTKDTINPIILIEKIY